MSRRRVEIELPATVENLRRVRAAMEAVLDPGPTTDQVLLVVQEACANVVRHRDADAGCSSLCVTADFEPHHLRITIGEFCTARDRVLIQPRALEDVRPGGLGTHFITQIMDRVHYVPDPHSPHMLALVLEKDLGTPQETPPHD